MKIIFMLVNSFLFASHPHVHIFNWRLLSRAYICERFFIVLQKKWERLYMFIHSFITSQTATDSSSFHHIYQINITMTWLRLMNKHLRYSHTHTKNNMEWEVRRNVKQKKNNNIRKSKVFGVWSHNCTL